MLRDYDDTNISPPCGTVPNSASGPQFERTRQIRATGGFLERAVERRFHLCQSAATRLGGQGWRLVMPLPAMAAHSRDLMNTGIDGLEFWKHEDEMSGVQFQRDLAVSQRWTVRFPCPVSEIARGRDLG